YLHPTVSHRSTLFPYTTLFRSCGFSDFFTYSNSIVAGGFPVQSYSTLLICFTSLTILLVVLPITSHGISALSAVIKSVVVTALRSEEHTSELQSRFDLVCRPLL